MNTGVRIVPNPNPEKKVRIATIKAAKEVMIIAMFFEFEQTN